VPVAHSPYRPIARSQYTPLVPIAILGGTFDPPHIGHLLLAECVRHQFGLDQVVLLPAGQPYRKAWRDVTPAHHRLAMTNLATAEDHWLTVDEREVRRDGPTYTVDTLEELRAEGAERPLLILGFDAVADMPNWKSPERIAELSRIVVALKGHDPAELPALARAVGLPYTPEAVDMPELAVSGTLIRQRIGEGKPVRHLLPDAVIRYIHRHGLYGAPPGGVVLSPQPEAPR